MPPRQRAAAVKHYRNCGCGCENSVRTAAAWYIPGHAPERIAIENASGQWVKVTNISLEPAAWARIGQIKDLDGTFLEVTIADHPTCGNFVWKGYTKGKMVQVKPTYAKR
jgi:hypothetical protein